MILPDPAKANVKFRLARTHFGLALCHIRRLRASSRIITIRYPGSRLPTLWYHHIVAFLSHDLPRVAFPIGRFRCLAFRAEPARPGMPVPLHKPPLAQKAPLSLTSWGVCCWRVFAAAGIGRRAPWQFRRRVCLWGKLGLLRLGMEYCLDTPGPPRPDDSACPPPESGYARAIRRRATPHLRRFGGNTLRCAAGAGVRQACPD